MIEDVPHPHLDVEVAGAVFFLLLLLVSLTTVNGDMRRFLVGDLMVALILTLPSLDRCKQYKEQNIGVSYSLSRHSLVYMLG